MFQYQAFSDDLNSPVCVPDVMLCETLVMRRKMFVHHFIPFTVFPSFFTILFWRIQLALTVRHKKTNLGFASLRSHKWQKHKHSTVDLSLMSRNAGYWDTIHYCMAEVWRSLKTKRSVSCSIFHLALCRYANVSSRNRHFAIMWLWC